MSVSYIFIRKHRDRGSKANNLFIHLCIVRVTGNTGKDIGK